MVFSFATNQEWPHTANDGLTASNQIDMKEGVSV